MRQGGKAASNGCTLRPVVAVGASNSGELWEPAQNTLLRTCKKSEGAREFIYQLLSVIGLGMLPRDTSCRHISEQCHAHWQRGHSRLRQLGAGHPEACMERIPAEKIWFQHQEHLLETRTWVEEKMCEIDKVKCVIMVLQGYIKVVLSNSESQPRLKSTNL